MKTTALIGLVSLTLMFAFADTKVDLEYEHQLKSSSSDDAVSEDMSKMKAMGKCGADQKAYKEKTVTTVKDVKPTEAELEYEHQLKSSSSDDAVSEDMSKMKAMGKCGADQKVYKETTVKDVKSDVKPTKAEAEAKLEYEHQLKSASSDDAISEDMSKMKAMGKCGADQKAYKEKTVTTVKDVKPTEAELEYEHQLKSADSDDAISEDMSKMKAMGKCGADQKAAK